MAPKYSAIDIFTPLPEGKEGYRLLVAVETLKRILSQAEDPNCVFVKSFNSLMYDERYDTLEFEAYVTINQIEKHVVGLAKFVNELLDAGDLTFEFEFEDFSA